jgi:two-component system response regulator YesN
VKILIVEDELLERRAMVQMIQDGFPKVREILTASNGEMAVSIAFQEKPELILMDINLPLLDGLSAASQIRERLPDIKIIIVSAYSDYEHMRSAILNQALDYLVKPYSIESFHEAVERGLLPAQNEALLYGKAGTIQKVQKYLEVHYSENITLKDIADEVCLERSYLGRLFREESGMTVMGYLKNVRIAHAKDLLLHGMTPGIVAQKTGFGDPAYFAKSFKQVTGVSPAKYRESVYKNS